MFCNDVELFMLEEAVHGKHNFPRLLLPGIGATFGALTVLMLFQDRLPPDFPW
jgi:hypothetical protein